MSFLTAISAIVVGVILGFMLRSLKLSASFGMSLLLPLFFALKPGTALLILIVTAIYCGTPYPLWQELNLKRIKIHLTYFNFLVLVLFSTFIVLLLREFTVDRVQFLALCVLCITAVICYQASIIVFSSGNIGNPRFLPLFLSMISAMTGLAIPTMGIDVGTGIQRYSMGITELLGGIDFIIVVLGLCCIGEILHSVSEYGIKQNGNLMTTGNQIQLLSSCKSAEIMFAMTLGIPCSESSAIIVGAFALYGIQFPNPLSSVFPHIGIVTVASLVIAAFTIFLYALPVLSSKLETAIEIIPERIRKTNEGVAVAIYPVFAVTAFIGAYSLNYRLFDMFLLIAFGFAGFLMRRMNIPITPLIVCAALGSRMEEAYRTPFSWSLTTVFYYLLSIVILSIYIKKTLYANSNSSSNASLNDVRDQKGQ
jgi:TctA family transporter